MSAFRTRTLNTQGLSFTALEMGDGPLVLCLHGFPDHNRSFREQAPALAAAGYRVVLPNLRGYEPGSQPRNGNYAIARITDDVLGWLDALGADKAHIVGHDWGAVIGYATAARAPERLHSLTTLAVPHLRRWQTGLRRVPRQIRNSWYMLFFQLRGLSDAVVRRHNFAFIEQLWAAWSPQWRYPSDEMDRLKETFRQPGVLRAALAYYRHLFNPLVPDWKASFRLLTARIGVPTLALTGASDECVDTRLYDLIMREEDFPRGLRVLRVPQAGHFLHQEKPREVNKHILEWLDYTG